MKQINYLSPTSIAMYAQSPDEFYLNYLADNRPPKIAQTKPMSIGSSFDAHAKSYLHEKIFGKGFDPKFELTSIFEQQVEKQNRDWALPNGKYAFEQYKMSGALGDLMLELNTCIGKPRFEFEVRGTVAGRRDSKMVGFGDLILLGKPDVFFINKMGAHVILDWKVNGYCGNRVLSPMQGYVRLRVKSGDKYMNKGQHKNAQLMNHNGMMLNVGGYLEHFDDSWARQLSIYAWLCGMQPGDDFITAIDQLACSPDTFGPGPSIRVAEHRLRVSKQHQTKIFDEAKALWDLCHGDHFFKDLTKEHSDLRCKMLDGTAETLISGSAEDKWFANMSRG